MFRNLSFNYNNYNNNNTNTNNTTTTSPIIPDFWAPPANFAQDANHNNTKKVAINNNNNTINNDDVHRYRSNNYDTQSMTYLESIRRWGSITPARDFALWNLACGKDFNWCECHKVAWPSIYNSDSEIAKDSKGKFIVDKKGCNCPRQTNSTADRALEVHYAGTLVEANSLRDAWYKAFELVKRTSAENDILDEYTAWVALCSSVWMFCNDRRRTIAAYHQHRLNNSNNSSNNTEAEMFSWNDDEQYMLNRHFNDVRLRYNESVDGNKFGNWKHTCITYCFQHRTEGDLLPRKGIHRYNTCGICVISVEESKDRQERAQKDNQRTIEAKYLSDLVERKEIRPEESGTIVGEKNFSQHARFAIQQEQKKQEERERESWNKPAPQRLVNKKRFVMSDLDTEQDFNNNNNTNDTDMNNHNTELKMDSEDNMY